VRYAGVDEVGYGALAGPLVSVAVAVDVDMRFDNFREWWPVPRVRDSKKTSAPQRVEILSRLMPWLVEHGASVGIGEIPPADIDRYGYSKALLWSKLEAMKVLAEEAPVDLLVVDGSIMLTGLHGVDQRVIPQADASYWIVAAASIIAKSYRDAIMLELHGEFPLYRFDSNMGYAGGGKQTSEHIAALRKHGLTVHHRKQACRTVLS
jgi:ribonuclease HII